MANKLPWFTHDHDAHADGWVRHLVRTQGHVAGWLWWVLLELHHKHGVGDVLKRNISDVARDALTSTSVVTRVLTEMGTEFEGQQKVSWELVGTELRLEIKKLRERQSKLKSKILARFRQHSSNLPLEGQEERERERDTPIPPKRGDVGFDKFWESYPKKKSKGAALSAWRKFKPSADLQEKILAAVQAQRSCEDWTKEGGKYIPYPATWLNAQKWEDEDAPDGNFSGPLVDRVQRGGATHV